MREGELPPSDEDDEDERTRLARERVGRLLVDWWWFDQLLGVGGTARLVDAGRNHRNGRRVAIKMLHPELSHNSEAKQRFIDEGYAANRVGHPGVSRSWTTVAEDGAVFLATDLLEGETLDFRMTRKEASSLSSFSR